MWINIIDSNQEILYINDFVDILRTEFGRIDSRGINIFLNKGAIINGEKVGAIMLRRWLGWKYLISVGETAGNHSKCILNTKPISNSDTDELLRDFQSKILTYTDISIHSISESK